MTISVVIPTCDRAELLGRCLDRLAPGAQSLAAERFEVIVTDDGKTSSSEQLIRDRYSWAKWIKGPRRGPAANRNNGARHAAGDWLAFTDDDCLPSPGWLSELARAAQGGTDVVEGKTTCSAGLRSPLDEAPVNLTGGNMWSCNLMFRRSVFDALGGFDEDFPAAWCEDVEMCGRIRRGGYAWRFAPDATVDHPPRRRRAGVGAGGRWESRVLLWYKLGNRRSTYHWLPSHLVKVRIAQALEFPVSRDWLIALLSIPAELASVLINLPAWERKCRSLVLPRKADRSAAIADRPVRQT